MKLLVVLVVLSAGLGGCWSGSPRVRERIELRNATDADVYIGWSSARVSESGDIVWRGVSSAASDLFPPGSKLGWESDELQRLRSPQQPRPPVPWPDAFVGQLLMARSADVQTPHAWTWRVPTTADGMRDTRGGWTAVIRRVPSTEGLLILDLTLGDGSSWPVTPVDVSTWDDPSTVRVLRWLNILPEEAKMSAVEGERR